MTVSCFIRYEIDPFQRVRGELGPNHPAPRRRPHRLRGVGFDSFAAYEAYRGRVKADPDGRANFAFARSRRLILREERTFLEVVDGTFRIGAGPVPG